MSARDENLSSKIDARRNFWSERDSFATKSPRRFRRGQNQKGKRDLLRQFGDAMRQARDFAACIVLVNNAELRRTHDRGLRGLECRRRCIAVT